MSAEFQILIYFNFRCRVTESTIFFHDHVKNRVKPRAEDNFLANHSKQTEQTFFINKDGCLQLQRRGKMRPLRYFIYYSHGEEFTTSISNIAKHSYRNNLGLTSILRAEKCISILALLKLQQSKMRKKN